MEISIYKKAIANLFQIAACLHKVEGCNDAINFLFAALQDEEIRATKSSDTSDPAKS